MRAVLAAAIVVSLSAAARAEAACPAGDAVAVDGLGTPAADFLRVAELMGATPGVPRSIERGGARTEAVCADAAIPLPRFVLGEPLAPRQAQGEQEGGERSFRVLPLRLGTVWNARYPSGDNDGLLWAGRGVSQLASGGVAFR